MKRNLIIASLALLVGLGAAYQTGVLSTAATLFEAKKDALLAKKKPSSDVAPPAVTAARVDVHDFVETVLVTGSLVAREEILVSPEVDGLRVLELKADEGDWVKKGDILAVLVFEQLDAQLAQNEAALARSDAAIAQAKSQIVEAEARLSEANASLERARPLVKDKYLSESVFDQRDAAAKSAQAQLAAAGSGLKSAEAEKAQVEAQRRELSWRRSNTEVRAPADGLISRRTARIGAIALGSTFGGVEPLFRIVAKGELEVAADVPESQVGKLAVGQTATIVIEGSAPITGTVRMVSPEVDKSRRVGAVRIFLGVRPELRIGAFAHGTIETARSRNLAVPLASVLYGDDGPTVQVINDGRVSVRRVEIGLVADQDAEVLNGVAEGDLVVAKAGTFLRDGDAVRAMLAEKKVSEAQQ